MNEETLLVKRYSNRKLYNTEKSCYITFDELTAIMKTGKKIQIIDNDTKEDITYKTQIQMLFEKEKGNGQSGDLELIRKLIISGGNLTDNIKNLDKGEHWQEPQLLKAA